MRAARSASARVMPAATWRSASASSAARSSSSSSRSMADLRNRFRSKLEVLEMGSMTSIRLEDEADRQHDPRPVLLLGRQLLQPRGGDAVVLGAPPFRRLAPLTLDEAVLFQPVQRREQRAGPDDERPAADLLNAVGDADPVPRLERQRLEDEEVERPFHQLRLLFRHGGAW